MKIENLRNIDSRKGKPNPAMSNTQWQEYFNFMKLSTTQSKDRYIRFNPCSIMVNNNISTNYFTYQGETQWSTYRAFINNVLRNIRRGEYDYCYYIYQITDLLKYEHDDLVTLWLPEYECFRVWLKSKLKITQKNNIHNRKANLWSKKVVLD